MAPEECDYLDKEGLILESLAMASGSQEIRRGIDIDAEQY
jgi:hypothetical protein